MTDAPAPPRAPRPDGWGYMPDKPSGKDLHWAPMRATLRATPQEVDIRRDFDLPVWDQGEIGSCVAHGTAYAFMHARDKLKLPRDWMPSRLFIYYEARARIGMPTVDSGCYVRDAFDVLRKVGAPPESYWKYVPEVADPATWVWKAKAVPARKPPARAYKEASKHQALRYMRVRNELTALKACLSEGWPIVFGFTVHGSMYDNRGNPKTEIPLPSGNDPELGGHCVALAGYSDRRGAFLLRNSWGPSVGEKGYQWIPYGYVTDPNLADDFWTLREIENRVEGVQ